MSTEQIVKISIALAFSVSLAFATLCAYALATTPRSVQCNDGCQTGLCWSDEECGPTCACLAADTPEGGLCMPRRAVR